MVSKIKKTILYALLFVLVLTSTSFGKNEIDQWPVYNEEILGESGFVMDTNSNIVLYEKNPDKKMYIASLTKIMTAIVVFDHVQDLDEEVFFSYNACNKDIDRKSTVIGATAGDKLTVKECLYAILLPSANDAANALAEHVAGNIHDFSLLMNEKAEKLGMTNTHFTNPSGLQNENQYSTARDIAIMMSYASKNETFLQISSSISYTHKPIRKYKNPNNSNNTMLNTNNLLIRGSKYYYNTATAGKTGYTKDAGYCLVATSKKDDLHLVCVSLNSKKINDRFIDAKNLFDFYHKNYNSYKIKDYDQRFVNDYSNLSISNVDIVKCIKITCDDNSNITLPKNTKLDNISSNIHFVLKNNQQSNAVGYIEYFLDNKKIGECEILGDNLINDSKINVQNLDISSIKDSLNNSQIEILEKTNYVNEDKLIYKDKIGNIKFSSGFSKLIIALTIIIFLVIIISFTYSKIFMTLSESINFILTRLISKNRNKKRTYKKH